jgi:UDP-2,4-diacetamido-2,4,6-trideoxy-beta-L-altropyranose hydrolase
MGGATTACRAMIRAAFIVDAGPTVGLGHLTRSLVLLKAMERQGVACTLYCADPATAGALGRNAVALPQSLRELSAVDLIVCDSYRVTEKELQAAHQRCRLLAVLDDTGDRPLPVDVVINHNLYAPTLKYGRVTDGRVLAGPNYALVDERIMKAAQVHATEAPGNVIVISFGGTDDGSLAAKAAEALLARTDARVDAIVSAGRAPSPRLLRLAEGSSGRVVAHHGPDVPALLAHARLYLGSAGMMSFEAFTIGLELIVVPIADNQRPGAQALVAYGHDLIATLEPDKLARAAARRLIEHRPIVPAPIDGRGGERITRELLSELAR